MTKEKIQEEVNKLIEKYDVLSEYRMPKRFAEQCALIDINNTIEALKKVRKSALNLEAKEYVHQITRDIRTNESIKQAIQNS